MRHRTLTKNLFTTNPTLLRSYEAATQKTATQKIVFISYRRTQCDSLEARRCAEILEDIPGLHYWLDEDDKCMQQAHAENDDLQKALCIEQGLDVSSALLGIIGPGTFDSPWIPYEIGGARGRGRYVGHTEIPHPRIAHYIHDVSPRDVPAFVGLGTPLISLTQVRSWAEHLADTLQDRYISEAQRQNIKNIYTENTRDLKLSSL